MGSARATTRSRLQAAVAVRDAADAVARGEGPADRGDAVLSALFSVVSPCAAAVERWDPVRGRHDTLAGAGYRDEALDAVEALFHEDPRFPVVRFEGRPLRVCDIDPAERSGPMFEQAILPGRFTDGVSLCLSAGPRYVGSVHASTSAGGVDDETVALLRLLSGDLARLVDPLDGMPVPVADDAGAFAWSPSDGRRVALSRSGRPSLVGAGSPLAELLSPSAWPSGLGRHLLVVAGGELLAVEARPSGRWVVVEHRPAVAPAGLSLRELEVLALLASGATNRMVARSLGVGERTVATHVEHLLAKLGVGNRAGAVAFAVTIGLVHVRGLPRR
ncbi:helix-turn-helix transcriptional regulator [Blastococcus sp. CT_GayMR19]|uniref:helix-turn-helix transcriptional regulator n=1 Tax=Blastococcus sp. CT_GayMR19 TaxID=2559608 RepID=UPI001ADD953D|nr:helix-turn-helix transcriptional regulator [Blastococcus sp. CT_GayMR19]